MRSPQSIGNTSARRYSSRELIAVPNPVRDQVTFHYQLPDPQQPGQLLIYDMQGKLTATLHCGPGTQQKILRTARQRRGLYYCIIQQAGYRSQALKVLLID